MHSLFEPTTAAGIIARVDKIQSNTSPRWGKMNAAQMLAHCQTTFQVYFGEKKMKRSFIGVLFGGMAKKRLFVEKPWPQNLPTAPEFVVKESKELLKEKMQLVEWIRKFTLEGQQAEPALHPFFGALTKEEWSRLAYKHLDHHLQQFGV